MTIWLPTTKIWESPRFPCVQVACNISLKSPRRGLQLCFRLHLNQTFTHKVMGPQSCGSPNFGNYSHLGVPGQNDIWVLVLWLGKKYTVRGKVVISPKSRPWWVLWIHVCLWFVRAPQCSNYALINLLFGLCKSVWIIELLVNLPSPISELQHTLLPSKCCEPGSVPQFLFLPLSSPLDSQLSPSRSLGVRHNNIYNQCPTLLFTFVQIAK